MGGKLPCQVEKVESKDRIRPAATGFVGFDGISKFSEHVHHGLVTATAGCGAGCDDLEGIEQGIQCGQGCVAGAAKGGFKVVPEALDEGVA